MLAASDSKGTPVSCDQQEKSGTSDELGQFLPVNFTSAPLQNTLLQ